MQTSPIIVVIVIVVTVMIICLMLSLLLLQMMMKMMMMMWFGLVQGIPCFHLAAKRQNNQRGWHSCDICCVIGFALFYHCCCC